MASDVAYLGVDGLDSRMPEGLTRDMQIMLHGDTGIGKTVLASQFLYEGLMVGDTCVYVACDDLPNIMRQSLASFRLGSGAYEEAGRLIFVDAYSRVRSTEKYWLPDPNVLDEFYLFEKKLLGRLAGRRVRLVVDSLSTLFIQNDPSVYLAFNANRLKLLRRLGVLTLDAFVKGVLDDRSLASLMHAYPVVINMQFENVGGSVRRIMQLLKMRSGEFQAAPIPLSISPKTGIIAQAY